ncbi:MAG: hypothetical protein QM781_21710 [Chitinophagaceae bacterium]
MKNNLSKFALAILLAGSTIFAGCDKFDPYKTKIPEPLAHFAGSSTQSYEIGSAAAAPVTITIGTTDVQNVDRTVKFSVSSPTGATAGTHYSLSNTTGSVTIPAGQSVASFQLQGIFAPYDNTGRKDTLVFALEEPSVKIADFQSKQTFLLRGPCFDGDVANISVMAGNYTQTFEGGAGPYTTTISNITSTGATTATGSLNNLWDYFGPVSINFDWTDPLNTKAEIPLQITNKEYAAGQPFYVRTKPGQSNKFSVCNERFHFSLDVLVLIGGSLYYYDNGLDYVMGR